MEMHLHSQNSTWNLKIGRKVPSELITTSVYWPIKVSHISGLVFYGFILTLLVYENIFTEFIASIEPLKF